MPYDLMSLPLLVGLVGGAFWFVVFAAVTTVNVGPLWKVANTPSCHDPTSQRAHLFCRNLGA